MIGPWLDPSLPVFSPAPLNLNHPLNQRLVAYWYAPPGLDGGVRAYDLRGLRHGTLTNFTSNATTGWRRTTGPLRTGLLCDPTPNTRVTLPRVLTTNRFTIEVTFNPTRDGSDLASGNGLFYQGSGSATLDTTLLLIGGIDFIYEGTQFDTTGSNPARVVVGQWHHLAVTYNGAAGGGTATTYLDGVSLGSQAAMGTGTPNANAAALGTWYDYSDNVRTFQGVLESVAIFDVPLSAAVAAARYASWRQGHPGLLNRFHPARQVAPAQGVTAQAAALLMAM